MPNGFHEACKSSDLANGAMQLCEIEDTLVIVFRVDDQFYCIDDVCTHDGGTLSDGTLKGCEIACPRHGARFDIRNGHAMSMPATKATRAHDVKIIDDTIMVKLAES